MSTGLRGSPVLLRRGEDTQQRYRARWPDTLRRSTHRRAVSRVKIPILDEEYPDAQALPLL